MSQAAKHDFGHLPPAAARLGHIFAQPKTVAALCVVVLAGLGWLYLALLLAGMRGSTSGVADSVLRQLCQALPAAPWRAESIAVVASMWGAMSLAMMLPSAAPMIMTYAGIADTAACKNERIVSPFILVMGYAAVWFSFSVVAALIQIALSQTTLIGSTVASTSGLFSGVVFLGAGFYQFTTLKHACLNRCQHPFPFFFANWSTTKRGVFRLGLKQGLYCLGCCWAMMLVMFAAGTMNILWMVGLGIVMTIEKMLTGRRFTYAVGVLLIFAGIGFVFASFATNWPVHAS